jgi:peptide/nickel transport system substrate-binding protein
MADVLFWVRPDGSLEPMLGESVTASSDGLKWTLKLKRGLKWSDGRPITAADYEYGVLARFSPDNKPLNELRNGRNIKGIQAYVKGEAKNVEGIKVVDDTTVEISLDAPDATMRTLWFGDTLIMPLPKHAIGEVPFRDLGRDKYWITSPLASGPYRFVRYQTDQFIEYERNPNYWDDKPRPDRLFMRIASPEVAIVSLEKGEIDLINPLALTEVARLKGLPNVEVVEAKNNAQWYGLERNFKVKNGIWRNPKAVQGLLHAIDRQAYVNSILQGYGVVRNSFYDGTPYQCPTLKKYDYNPDRAKQLWQEVGMPQDQVISFMSWPGIKARMDFLPIAQEYVRKLGYKSEVDFIDNSLIQDYIQGKGPRGENWDFHVLLFGPGSDPGTPESFIDPNSTSNWAYRSWPEPPGPDGRKKPAWVYNNPKLLELYQQGKTESDPQKRIPIYQQADCIWNEELPCIMIASPSFMIAKSKRLQGVDWQTNAGLALWTRMYRPGDWWIAG